MKIEVYTTEDCFHCHRAKEFLRKNGVDFVEHNVTQNIEKARDIFRLSGQLGVPMTLWGGEVVVGFDEKKFKELLNGRRKED